MGTQFSVVYDRFLDNITDDMYLELTELDTKRDQQRILLNVIPDFEFPKVPLTYHLETIDEIDSSYFDSDLTNEEINILALLMVTNWLQRQVTSIENTRMKYSGSDYKFTSQANHLSKLIVLQDQVEKKLKHRQRLYGRRKVGEDGTVKSNWSRLREKGRY